MLLPSPRTVCSPYPSVALRIASDLHYEFCGERKANSRFWERITEWVVQGPEPSKCILVLPGDMCRAFYSHGAHTPRPYLLMENLLTRFKTGFGFSEVVFVAGNHEFYQSQRQFENVEAELTRVAHLTGTHFLNRSRCVLQGVEFLGCVLWAPVDDKTRFNDFALGNVFACVDQLAVRHAADLRWLRKQLDKPRDSSAFSRVVITHHLPSQLLIHPRFFTWAFGGYAVPDMLPETMEVPGVDYWFCGHSHEHMTIQSPTTCFYMNPLGYPEESRCTMFQPAVFELMKLLDRREKLDNIQ
jgi:UDP-2,3-diacylglucosamine pyrophosphatase LpxH